MNSLEEVIQQFEATENNLSKLHHLWGEIQRTIPEGIAFEDPNGGLYDYNCKAFLDICNGLPAIDGYRLSVRFYNLNEIAQMRLDAADIWEPESVIDVELCVAEPEKQLQEYQYRFNKKRRQFVRSKVLASVDRIDGCLQELSEMHPDNLGIATATISSPAWDTFEQVVSALDLLLGSSTRPRQWAELQQSLSLKKVGDLWKIKEYDWPAIKSEIISGLYGECDPIPVSIEDLGLLVQSKPTGEVITKLKWDTLGDSDFERLLFCIISQSEGYENPEWLTNTNAPDKGRDLSVTRVFEDSLTGTTRHRVIIQCKHWLSKSVGLQDIASAREQMRLWEPPRVDMLVIATSGRFTTDAIQYVEKNNQSDTGLRVEMWPESHLERLLASRPALIAKFGLR